MFYVQFLTSYLRVLVYVCTCVCPKPVQIRVRPCVIRPLYAHLPCARVTWACAHLTEGVSSTSPCGPSTGENITYVSPFAAHLGQHIRETAQCRVAFCAA